MSSYTGVSRTQLSCLSCQVVVPQPTRCPTQAVPWTLLTVSDWVVVSGAALEPQRILELPHAEAASQTAETRAAQLDASRNEARSLDLELHRGTK